MQDKRDMQFQTMCSLKTMYASNLYFLFHHIPAYYFFRQQYRYHFYVSFMYLREKREEVQFCRFWFKHEMGIKSTICAASENILNISKPGPSQKEATAIWEPRTLQEEHNLQGRKNTGTTKQKSSFLLLGKNHFPNILPNHPAYFITCILPQTIFQAYCIKGFFKHIA